MATITNAGEGVDAHLEKSSYGDQRPRGVAPVTILPDPLPARRRYSIVSVDDHLLEPGDLFERWLPVKFRPGAPRIIERDDGAQSWLIDGKAKEISMGNAAIGRPQDEWRAGPIRLDEAARGTWDVHARVSNMDIAGIWASLGFPSIPWGFAGQAFSHMGDSNAGIACLRAYNDWLIEEWCGSYPTRLIPSQLPWLRDVDQAVEEVVRNASRGVRAVSFTENPERLGFPSIHTGYWDRFFAACEDTGTVINLHVGSGSWTPIPSSDSPELCFASLFPVTSLIATADWLWSGIPLRFPRLRIALSEGGIGWVPLLLDRINYLGKHLHVLGEWPKAGPTPEEVVMRNFRFCSLSDPLAWKVMAEIAIDKVMFEVDYPHLDSTWPDSQEWIYRQIGHLDDDAVRKVTYENACTLYQHPSPPSGWAESRPIV
jgi:predicted TIM-barrel fold metal-dependent hydrolase